MNHRERLIAMGLVRPATKVDPEGPTPQAWRDEPTVRLDTAAKRDVDTGRAGGQFIFTRRNV